MNAILYTDESSSLTAEESQIFEQAEEIIGNYKNSSGKKRIWLIVLLITIVVLLAFLGVFSTIFALINAKSDVIMRGVSILGVDVSGLSKEEATAKVSEELSARLSTDVVFVHNEQVYTLLPTEVNASFDFSDAVNDAFAIGRSGNIFKNNFAILDCMIHTKDLSPVFSYNSDTFAEAITQMNGDIADRLVEPYYEIDGNNLNIHSGKSGYVVDSEALNSYFVSKLTASVYSSDTIIVPVIYNEPRNIDIDSIYSEVHKEAKDAYYTKEPFAVFPSSTGVDFNISVDEAKALITGDSDTYTIPLKTLYPKVTTSDIGIEAFPNLLAQYSSNYSSSNGNRANNVALAASKINGIVLMPGDVFSFNGTVGKRTPQAGFKVAGVYVAGRVTSDYGGGICQVSSTLYNAVIRANLEIVERTNHQFDVGYVPIGTDATVSWGAPDFKFKNSRNYPIKIVATTANRNVYVKVYGLKEEDDYDVEIVSYRTGSIPFTTTYTTDASLPSGETKVIQAGSNGARSEAYRVLKKNGKVVSRQLLSKDTYSPHNQIIAVGK